MCVELAQSPKKIQRKKLNFLNCCYCYCYCSFFSLPCLTFILFLFIYAHKQMFCFVPIAPLHPLSDIPWYCVFSFLLFFGRALIAFSFCSLLTIYFVVDFCLFGTMSNLPTLHLSIQKRYKKKWSIWCRLFGQNWRNHDSSSVTYSSSVARFVGEISSIDSYEQTEVSGALHVITISIANSQK